MVHSSHLQQYFPKNKFLATFLYQKSHLVCVSKGVEKETKKTYPLENTSCIYNPIPQNIDPENVNSPETNFILFFGRFDESSKDLTFLINAYSKSILKSKNIKLILLGDGEDKLKLMELVANLALADFVIFKPYNPNPFSYVKSAMFTVLTSNYEGFGMSILESLACETPVVSVDCESGPKELIVNGFNGLLVKKELDTYIQALNSMATNKKLLATCKSNCLKSIEHFSPDHIKKEWKKLIDEVLLF